MFLRNTEEEARVGVFPTGLFSRDSQNVMGLYCGSVIRKLPEQAGRP